MRRRSICASVIGVTTRSPCTSVSSDKNSQRWTPWEIQILLVPSVPSFLPPPSSLFSCLGRPPESSKFVAPFERSCSTEGNVDPRRQAHSLLHQKAGTGNIDLILQTIAPLLSAHVARWVSQSFRWLWDLHWADTRTNSRYSKQTSSDLMARSKQRVDCQVQLRGRSRAAGELPPVLDWVQMSDFPSSQTW